MNAGKNADTAGTRAALFRAVRRACELAKKHNHPVVIGRDGKAAYVSPQEVLGELDAYERKETQKG